MTTVTFETWRERFEKSIGGRTREWTAFHTYMGFLEQQFSGKPQWARFDVRRVALLLIYASTGPAPRLDEQKRKRDAYIRKALRGITIQVESFVSNLRNTAQFHKGRVIVRGDSHALGIDLSSLLNQYQCVVESSRSYLSFLEWRWVRRPNILDQGIGLSLTLTKECRVQERPALALVRLALLAHGYPEDKLEDLRDPGKIRAGNFRKRKEVYLKQRAYFDNIAFPSPNADKSAP
jgi:hypothetical protein